MKKAMCFVLAAGLLLGLAACGGAPAGSAPAASSGAQSAPGEADSDAGPVETLPSGELVLADGTLPGLLTAFAANTAGAVVDAEGNSCYSPTSLYMALALASAGAGGDTLAQLLAVLGAEDAAALNAMMAQAMAALPFDGYEEALANYDQAVEDYKAGWTSLPEGLSDEELKEHLLPAEGAGSRLELGNSAWLNSLRYNGYLPDFEAAATETFKARMEALPFGEPTTDAALNGWIKDNTGGRIDPGLETDPELALYLVNTVYYLDKWVSVFSAANNTTEPFTLPGGTSADREYMHKTVDHHQYYRGPGYAASYLELEHGRMTFILPDEGTTPADLLVTPGKIEPMLAPDEWETAEVVFQVPKFTFETELEPMDALKSIGLELPFDRTAADLTGFTELPGGENLFISDIMQQTFIKVDEEGAEAAAATIIAITPTAMPIEEPEVFELLLTRPFIFVLERDLATEGGGRDRVPLFIGVVNDPSF